MDSSPAPIVLEDIRFAYRPDRPVLEGAGFRLHAGEKVGLIGPNGSGKSTFLHIIMGLLKPSSGTVRLFGKPARVEADFQQARRRIGLVFQNADDQLFSPTVLEDVAFGLLNLGVKPADARRRAMETIEELDLEGFEDRITHRLSGGEKRMVALSTVLAMKPDVLLLDEPNSGLDERTYERIIQVIRNLSIGCVIVSHEYDFLARTTQSIYAVRDGGLLFNGASSALHSHLHVHAGGLAPHAHGSGPPHPDHDECHSQPPSLSDKTHWIPYLETSIRRNREEAEALRRMACDLDEEAARSVRKAAEHMDRQNEHLTFALAALKPKAQ